MYDRIFICCTIVFILKVMYDQQNITTFYMRFIKLIILFLMNMYEVTYCLRLKKQYYFNEMCSFQCYKHTPRGPILPTNCTRLRHFYGDPRTFNLYPISVCSNPSSQRALKGPSVLWFAPSDSCQLRYLDGCYAYEIAAAWWII